MTSILSLCGLSEKESKLYWILVNNGVVSGKELVQKSGYKKGNTYALVHQLEKKGLVLAIEREGKTYFQPEPPQKVLQLLEKKTEETQQAKNFFEQVIPRLSSRYQMAVNKPIIQYYEGKEGLRKVFEDVYNPKNNYVIGCLDLEESEKAFPSFIVSELIPHRVKNKLQVEAILADSPKTREIAQKDKEQLRKTILVDKKKFPMPAEIEVYQDKIAMLSFEKGQFIGIIIQNQEMASSLMTIFKLAHQAYYGKKSK